MGKRENGEKLKAIHEFLDGMTKKEVKKPMVSMPKWLLQGLFYGTFLGGVGYIVGAMAMNAIAGLFPANFDIIMGALGFIGSVGIAYTNDITEK